MTPAARIQATLEILEHLEKSPVPMDTTISDYMRGRRYIGSKDRANIAERVYNIVRAHARLGWWLEQTNQTDTPRARLILWLVLAELKSGAFKIEELFDGSKYAAEKLDMNEKKITGRLKAEVLDNKSMPEMVRYECPPEHEAALRELFGKDFTAEMQAMMEGATLDLRVNLAKVSREDVKDALHKDRVHTDLTPYSVSGLRAQNKAFLSKTKAFIKGWIDIQDEGSQLITQFCEAQPGMQVLDYCAGAGGKTLALADAMRGKGRIVAMDTEKRRLDKAKLRFKRAGVSDIIETRPLSEERHKKWLKRQKGTFDLVLADVPCSGTGTWRRNPDTRWRRFGPSLDALIATQTDILEKAAKAVKPGGRFVYATCSLFPQENEQQIQAFLNNHPEFEFAPQNQSFAQGQYMRLTPHRHNTDGFFAAVLQRKNQ